MGGLSMRLLYRPITISQSMAPCDATETAVLVSGTLRLRCCTLRGGGDASAIFVYVSSPSTRPWIVFRNQVLMLSVGLFELQ